MVQMQKGKKNTYKTVFTPLYSLYSDTSGTVMAVTVRMLMQVKTRQIVLAEL